MSERTAVTGKGESNGNSPWFYLMVGFNLLLLCHFNGHQVRNSKQMNHYLLFLSPASLIARPLINPPVSYVYRLLEHMIRFKIFEDFGNLYINYKHPNMWFYRGVWRKLCISWMIWLIRIQKYGGNLVFEPSLQTSITSRLHFNARLSFSLQNSISLSQIVSFVHYIPLTSAAEFQWNLTFINKIINVLYFIRHENTWNTSSVYRHIGALKIPLIHLK